MQVAQFCRMQNQFWLYVPDVLQRAAPPDEAVDFYSGVMLHNVVGKMASDHPRDSGNEDSHS